MTPLSDYLHILLGNDETLKHFLADPVGQCDAHGLTKAERTVLRRVATFASTDSTNGYAIVRPLGAYRQALRVVQNVMHNNMGKAHALGAGFQNGLYIYFSGNTADPFTTPYAAGAYYGGNGSNILELMQDVAGRNPGFSYADSTIDYHNPNPIIGSITINGAIYNAPPPPPPITQSEIPFWFYSLNGTAGPTNSGMAGASYATQTVSPGDIIYWQVIAPSVDRGFQPCGPAPAIHTAGLV